MQHINKHITVWLMSFCLVFLTGINFVLYPPASQDTIMCADNGDNSPPLPVEEERSETSGSASVAEEYLHDLHGSELSWLDKISMQKVHDAARLEIVHYELLSPPPELS